MLMKDLTKLGYVYELSGNGIANLSLEALYFKVFCVYLWQLVVRVEQLMKCCVN